MVQSSFNTRFEKLKKRGENALQFFSEEVAIYMPLDKENGNVGVLHFYFMKYVRSCLMISKSLEEFIARVIINRQEAEEKLHIPEELDWVDLCVKSAQIHTGKGVDRLTMYSYIHASYDLVKHYELKILKMMLDEMEGRGKDFTEFLTKIDGSK